LKRSAKEEKKRKGRGAVMNLLDWRERRVNIGRGGEKSEEQAIPVGGKEKKRRKPGGGEGRRKERKGEKFSFARKEREKGQRHP